MSGELPKLTKAQQAQQAAIQARADARSYRSDGTPKGLRIQRTQEAQDIYDESVRLSAKLFPMAVSGLKESKKQSKNASKPRPIKNELGETLDDVIRTLANEPSHRDEQRDTPLPNVLWPHLKTAIEEWSGGDCKESRPDANKRDSWLYSFTRTDGIKDTITYQTFRRKLAKNKK
jgi:hypothetical protein